MAERIKRAEIWQYSFPRPDKRRPVLILTRPEVIELLHTVMVAPITSTIHGAPSEVIIGIDEGLKQDSAVTASPSTQPGSCISTPRPTG